MPGVIHRIEPDAGTGGILLLDEIHHFSVHHRFLHDLLSVVKLQLVDHAAILLSGILHLDRRTIKDVIAGFSKIGVKALACLLYTSSSSTPTKSSRFHLAVSPSIRLVAKTARPLK